MTVGDINISTMAPLTAVTTSPINRPLSACLLKGPCHYFYSACHVVRQLLDLRLVPCRELYRDGTLEPLELELALLVWDLAAQGELRQRHAHQRLSSAVDC